MVGACRAHLEQKATLGRGMYHPGPSCRRPLLVPLICFGTRFSLLLEGICGTSSRAPVTGNIGRDSTYQRGNRLQAT
jgi:hypothetical protein